MTPEERELLTKSIKLAEENNRMLRGMRRNARFASIVRAIYWLIILGIAFGTYYFVQPYLQAAMKGYTEMQKGIESVTKVTTKMPTLSEFNLPTWLGGATSTNN